MNTTFSPIVARCSSLIGTLAVSLFVFQNAQAQSPFYDGFNYTAGKTLGVGGNGIWSKSMAAVVVASGNLDGTGVGLTASSGNMITVTGGTSQFSSSNTKGDFTTTALANTAYFSFLIKLNDTANVDTTGAGTPIIYLNGGGSNSKTYVAPLLYNNGGNVEIGIGKYSGTTNLVASGFITSGTGSAIQDGNVYLVVGKVQFNAGNTNDTVSLWVNPVSLSNGEDPHPQVNAIGIGTTDGPTGGVGRVFFNQGYDASIDELRIGTSWANVTPTSFPAPVAAQIGFTALPVNAIASTTLSPVVVTVEDTNGAGVFDSGVSVTLSLSSGSGNLTGTLTQVTDGNGNATFNDLAIDQSGPKQFTAAASGFANVTSATFNVGSSIVTGPLIITNSVLSGASFIISGNGGSPGGGYNVLTSTNAATPMINWATSGVSQFDLNGGFAFTNAFSSALPPQFFRLQPF
jgi:hypothetical protein